MTKRKIICVIIAVINMIVSLVVLNISALLAWTIVAILTFVEDEKP